RLRGQDAFPDRRARCPVQSGPSPGLRRQSRHRSQDRGVASRGGV
ncbi:MAG: hypothetical protein AVDCRST_MAG87-3289, partial [uncultured Thermomicrobiales bacterium]